MSKNINNTIFTFLMGFAIGVLLIMIVDKYQVHPANTKIRITKDSNMEFSIEYIIANGDTLETHIIKKD